MLILIWWMYAGYAWLTNAVGPDRVQYQLILLAGMAGWLVVSLAVPTAFGAGGLAFGTAFLVIVLIHGGLFTRSQAGQSAVAILTVAPLNVAAGICLVLAGVLGGAFIAPLWGVAAALVLLPSLRNLDDRFEIAPHHFVERHGLVVIIALGESVVAVGIGATGHPLTPGLVAVAILGLGLSACLWWAYFGGGEDDRMLEAMIAAPASERANLAVRAFYHWHLLILLGVIALASALELAIAHPLEPLTLPHSLALGGGAALFMLGEVLVRRTLGFGRVSWRLAAAALALATVLLGFEVAAVAEIACLFGVLALCLAGEARAAPAPA
jgi:low temperature requirement protein LtrA